MYISEETYLVHYGVKGMKWGVRRYENERVRKARSDYDRIRKTKGVTSSTVRSSKKELSDAKIEAKIQAKKLAPTKHEQKLMKKYMERDHMTESEARIQAYKTARFQKAVAIVGGLTVAGAAAYLGKRAISTNVDSYIQAGTKLQNLNNHNPQEMKQVFYASLKRSDKLLYKAKYAPVIAGRGDTWNTTIKTTGRIKVASERTGRKVLDDMMKNDPKFKAEFINALKNDLQYVGKNSSHGKVYTQALADINAGKMTKSVYDARNIFLVDRTGATATQNAKFYEALKKKGYGAIRDVNDIRYSGFKAKAPTIIFDTGKAQVAKSSKMTVDDIDKAIGKFHKINEAKDAAATAGINIGVIGGAFGGAFGGANAASSASDKRYVKKYREEHPNSNLSYNEIIRLRKR